MASDWKEKRKQAYRDEADYLYMEYVRKERPKQDWYDKIKEIKERYPKEQE